MNKALKITLFSFVGVIATAITALGGFIIFASATTYHEKDVETIDVSGSVQTHIDKSQTLDILSWNIGYGALDEKADFYMDGGKGVIGESKENTVHNVITMRNKIKELDPDMFLIQEADINSKRSHYVNDPELFNVDFDGTKYDNSLAINFKAGFIPIPLGNPLGKVESGIATYAKYEMSSAKRIQLPIPFKWPIKLMNLKRCLLVSYLPIKDSDKSVVLVNLHLEAYDDGEGKAKQLKMLMDILKEESEKGNYVIAGGDFNQTFSNTDYQKYPKMNDWVCPVIDVTEYPNFKFLMDDSVPTCRSLNKPYINSDRSTHQYYMIDGFIISNNIQVNTLETIDLGFKNSDHNPVAMNFNLL